MKDAEECSLGAVYVGSGATWMVLHKNIYCKMATAYYCTFQIEIVLEIDVFELILRNAICICVMIFYL